MRTSFWATFRGLSTRGAAVPPGSVSTTRPRADFARNHRRRRLRGLSLDARLVVADSPLFDYVYYQDQVGKTFASRLEALEHFAEIGYRHPVDTSPFFRSRWYLDSYQVKEPLFNSALLDFLLRSEEQVLRPHPLIWPDWSNDCLAGLDGLNNFIEGLDGSDGIDPNPLFESAWYSRIYQARSPFRHYLGHAWTSGVEPNHLFNTDFVMGQLEFDQRKARGRSPLEIYLAYSLDGDWLSPNPLFDVEWYKTMNPDVSGSGIPAFLHFLVYGEPEFRAPCRNFEPLWYVSSNPDVADSQMSPLEHFARYGHREGRLPRDPNHWVDPTALIRRPSLPAESDEIEPIGKAPKVMKGLSIAVVALVDCEAGASAVISAVSELSAEYAWFVHLLFDNPCQEEDVDIPCTGHLHAVEVHRVVAGSSSLPLGALALASRLDTDLMVTVDARGDLPTKDSQFELLTHKAVEEIITHFRSDAGLGLVGARKSLRRRFLSDLSGDFRVTLELAARMDIALGPSLEWKYPEDSEFWARPGALQLAVGKWPDLISGEQESLLPESSPWVTSAARGIERLWYLAAERGGYEWAEWQGSDLRKGFCLEGYIDAARSQSTIRVSDFPTPIPSVAVGVLTITRDPNGVMECLASVLRQRVCRDEEAFHSVAVLVNGVSNAALRVPQGVRVINSPVNLGFGLGHNKLMAEAFTSGADFYLAVNDDGMLFPGSIEALVRTEMATLRGALVDGIQFPIEHPKPYDSVTFASNWASGACLLISRRVYESVGGFDPRFFMYCEDVDLSWRALAAGFEVLTCPEAVLRHETSQRDFDPVRHEMLLASQELLHEKWSAPDGDVGQAPMKTCPSLRGLLVADFSHGLTFAQRRW